MAVWYCDTQLSWRKVSLVTKIQMVGHMNLEVCTWLSEVWLKTFVQLFLSLFFEFYNPISKTLGSCREEGPVRLLQDQPSSPLKKNRHNLALFVCWILRWYGDAEAGRGSTGRPVLYWLFSLGCLDAWISSTLWRSLPIWMLRCRKFIYTLENFTQFGYGVNKDRLCGTNTYQCPLIWMCGCGEFFYTLEIVAHLS